MLYFNYYSLNRHGHKRKGLMAGTSLKEIQHRLGERGEYLIRCREVSKLQMFFYSVNKKHLEEVCLHFKEMSQAGIPLLEIVESLKHSSPSAKFKDIFEDLHFNIENGASLSEAMAYYPHIFNQVFLGMMKAAEATGQLSTAFKQLAEFIKTQQAFKIKVLQSLRYPFLLLMMIILLVILLSESVVPQVRTLISNVGGEIPFSTRILIAISEKTSSLLLGGVLITGISSSFLIILILLSQKIKMYCHRMVFRIPVIGQFFKDLTLFYFFQILNILHRNNISIFDALETSQSVLSNLFMKQKVFEIIEKIKKGYDLSTAFQDEHFFSSYSVRMLSMGMKTGDLKPGLQCISHHYHYSIEQKTAKFITYLEPIGLMVMGGIIFWIVLAIFLPLYNQLTLLDI